jgi:hypothetical protein
MVDWNRFSPADFEYDFERDELEFRGAPKQELSRPLSALGQTIGGRKLKIIFPVKDNNVVRIITGWGI